MPEDIIDLREVSDIVRTGTGRKLLYYVQAVYGQALKSLIRKGYFSDVEGKLIKADYMTNERTMAEMADRRAKCLRFVRMNMDKFKYYGCKHNT